MGKWYIIHCLQLWRNWHTRMIQVHVHITWVWVQVPSTAEVSLGYIPGLFSCLIKNDW